MPGIERKSSILLHYEEGNILTEAFAKISLLVDENFGRDLK